MINTLREQAKTAANNHPQVISKLKENWKKVGFYEYRDKNGKSSFWKIRLDPPQGSNEKKWIRPLHFDGNNWALKEPKFVNGKKPLYRLPELITNSNKTIWVVEGERCADELAKFGFIVTTSGSADSSLLADWQPLAEQQVVIWRDNDTAGLRYAQEATKQLQRLKCNVKWVDIDKLGLSDKGDVIDWIKINPSIMHDDIENLSLIEPQIDFTHKQEIIWPESKPLQRELSPPTAFPVDALGELLAPATYKMAEAIQAPIAICGQSLLAAATLAVQGYADIVIDGRVSPLSEFFLTIAHSGERKSAVDRIALWPHRDYQEKLREQYSINFSDWQRKLVAYEVSKKEALNSKKNKSFEDKKRSMENLGDSPLPPIEPLLIFEEPTYEGLVKLFVNGQPSVGLFNDEGGRFIGGNGMNQENLLKTAAGLSTLWDGRAITRVRAGDGTSLLPGRRLSLHLMTQPAIAQLMLSNNTLIEQGLLSRCLVTWPASTAGTRRYREIDLSNSLELKKYTARILEILETPLLLAEGKQNELKPRLLPLSPEAKQLWITFHDAIEKKLIDGGQFASIRGLANKAPEHSARLAGVLALVEHLQCSAISLKHMQAGIELTNHYLNEALRLFEAGAIDPDLSLAEKLLHWLQLRNESVITLIEIYQFGPNAIRNAHKARILMNILVEHGWAIPLNEGAIFQSKLRNEAWQLSLNK